MMQTKFGLHLRLSEKMKSFTVYVSFFFVGYIILHFKTNHHPRIKSVNELDSEYSSFSFIFESGEKRVAQAQPLFTAYCLWKSSQFKSWRDLISKHNTV